MGGGGIPEGKGAITCALGQCHHLALFICFQFPIGLSNSLSNAPSLIGQTSVRV